MTQIDIAPREPRNEPTYLGDGLYAMFDGWQIKLWASNGLSVTNEVWLEPSVLARFLEWVREVRAER